MQRVSAKNQQKILKVFNWLAKLCTTIIAVIQLLDFTFASLEMQDFLGSGNVFKDPVRVGHRVFNGQPAPGGENVVTGNKLNYKNAMSKYGYLMLAQIDEDYAQWNWGSVGSFDVSKSSKMQHCSKFKDVYPGIMAQDNRIGAIREKLSFIRPLSVGDSVAATWSQSSLTTKELSALEADGYVGARRALDLRFTERFEVPDAGKIDITTRVTRFYGKSFCDGCHAMAELNIFTCSLMGTATWSNDTMDYTLNITSATNLEGSYNQLGLAYPSSLGSSVTIILKILLSLLVLHTMLFNMANGIKSAESRIFQKKQEGADGANTSAVRPFFAELFFPEHYQCETEPFSVGFIMFNSDLIVYLQFLLTIVNLIESMAIQREIIWWFNYDPTFRAFLTRLAISCRVVWVYLAVFKMIKAVAIRTRKKKLIGQLIYQGYSFVAVYIICLFTLDILLDVFYTDRIDITNDPEMVSSVGVSVFDGFYMHRLPGFFLHTVLSVILSTGLLMVSQKIMGNQFEGNTLYELFVYSHASVIWDTSLARPVVHKGENAVVSMPIGSIMNMKWFMSNHMLTYRYDKVKLDKYALAELASDTSQKGSDNTESDVNSMAASGYYKKDSRPENVYFVELGRDRNMALKPLRGGVNTNLQAEQTLVFYKFLKENTRVKVH